MSLGYVKGRYWVSDERFAVYVQRDSYKALLRACTKAGFGFTCEYSYTARRYTAEIITIERFENSKQLYIVKRGNAYDANPMHAITTAIREYEGSSVQARACCLEIECELLRDAAAEAKTREAREAGLRLKLNRALDTLAELLPDAVELLGGTLFERMTALAKPPVTVQDRLERTRREAMQYDEDDDL